MDLAALQTQPGQYEWHPENGCLDVKTEASVYVAVPVSGTR
jgi:hypothetical protein